MYSLPAHSAATELQVSPWRGQATCQWVSLPGTWMTGGAAGMTVYSHDHLLIGRPVRMTDSFLGHIWGPSNRGSRPPLFSYFPCVI